MHYMRWYTRDGDVGGAEMLRRDGWTDEARFWDSVEKSDGCWIWKGQILQHAGYGHFWCKNASKVMAHRFAYEAVIGPIPEGLEIDHLCRVPACVNPAHLEAVTHVENMRRRKEANTHCKHGHEWTPENMYITGRGTRQCRTCAIARATEQYRRKKAAREASSSR